MNEQEVLELAIETYGNEKQTDMMIEEMSELAKALLKYRRSPYSEELESIREEMADVAIMLEQMRLIYGRYDRWYAYKVNRLAERLGARADE